MDQATQGLKPHIVARALYLTSKANIVVLGQCFLYVISRFPVALLNSYKLTSGIRDLPSKKKKANVKVS